MKKKSVKKEVNLAEKVSRELHMIPHEEMLDSERTLQTYRDLIIHQVQIEDEQREHLHNPHVPEVLRYPSFKPWKQAPLRAFISSILP